MKDDRGTKLILEWYPVLCKKRKERHNVRQKDEITDCVNWEELDKNGRGFALKRI